MNEIQLSRNQTSKSIFDIILRHGHVFLCGGLTFLSPDFTDDKQQETDAYIQRSIGYLAQEIYLSTNTAQWPIYIARKVAICQL